MTTQSTNAECVTAPWRAWPPEATGERPLPRPTSRTTKAELERRFDEVNDRLWLGEIEATLPADGFVPKRAMDDLEAAIGQFRESEEAAAMTEHERGIVVTNMIFRHLEQYPEPQRTQIVLRILQSLIASLDDDET